ncbi:hypothetical protein VXE65_20795 [Mycolicibacterium conceptionense]|uniref:hypothetical protein n=1 Tax=Mycolicibacterium conceptionense TaxID=451644 RepID=UPI0032048D00
MSTPTGDHEWTSEAVDGASLVHLARLATAGDQTDIVMYVRRQAHRLRARAPQTSQALTALIDGAAPPPSPLRGAAT